MAAQILIESGGDGAEIAIAALIVSVLSAIWTVWWSFREEGQDKIDGFWFRQVVFPQCLVPLSEFCVSWSERIAQFGGTLPSTQPAQQLFAEFSREKENLLRRLRVSKLLMEQFYNQAAAALDDFEDLLAEEINAALSPLPGRAVFDASGLRDSLSELHLRTLSSALRTHKSNALAEQQPSGND